MQQEIKERIDLINKRIVPAGCKKTSVGICPIEWKTYKIGEIAQVVGGGTPDTKNLKYFNGDINWFTPTEIGLTRYVSESKMKITVEGLKNSAAKIIPAGNILLTSRATIGEMSFNLVDCSTNQGFQSLIIKDDILKKIVYFNNYKLKKQMLVYANGSTFLEISNKDVKKLKINVSDKKEENIAIVKILDCATRQVELQEQLVDKLKVQKKAIMQRIFNGEYKTISIQEALNKNYLREIKPKELEKYNGTKNYLSTSSVVQDEIVLIEDVVTYKNRPSRAQMKPLANSVWFAKMTNSIKVIKADKNLEDNYILSTGFYGFLCDEINLNSDYLKQFFLSDYFNKMKDLYSEGSSQNGIKSNALEKLLIPFVVLERQQEIASWLTHIDKNIFLQQKLLDRYKLRQKALIQLLLAGIVRVN